MKYLSVCSGIEAASVAWHGLGWQPVAFSEIEPFPSAVLAHHYPSVPNLGDMTRFEEWPVELLADADILVGGSPCQAFSIAGKRESLADARGNLTLVYTKLLEAIDEQRSRAGRPPAICIWENVPGVLSTKDNAFGCFLAGLVGEEVPLQAPRGKWKDAGVVVGPERLAAWRILDAQFFGVAQRRRRVFLVSVSLRHPRAWACAAAVLPLIQSLRRDNPPSREAREAVAGTIAARFGISRNNHEELAWTQCFAGSRQSDVAATLETTAHDYSRADGFNMVAQPIPIHDQATRHAGKRGNNQDGKGNGLGIGQPGDPAPTLTKGDKHAVAQPIAFKPGQSAAARSLGAQVDIACTLEGGGGGNNKQAIAQPVATVMQVRRLTPTECERLQGFLDGYTNIPWRKKDEAPDGPRYKALGNSMAVPCMRWIGQRIAEVDNDPLA